eukprot:9159971-Pyramimonas_sp.AAC.1
MRRQDPVRTWERLNQVGGLTHADALPDRDADPSRQSPLIGDDRRAEGQDPTVGLHGVLSSLLGVLVRGNLLQENH